MSYEDPEQDILIGLLRLRKCSEDTFRPELKGGCSIVRELHVYGSVVPVHARDPTKFQHQVSSLFLLDVTNQTQGSHRLEKYLNLEGFLEKSLKIKSAINITGKSLKSLEKSLNSTIFCRTKHCR